MRMWLWKKLNRIAKSPKIPVLALASRTVFDYISLRKKVSELIPAQLAL